MQNLKNTINNNEEEPMNTIGQKITALREGKCMTKTELSNKLDVSVQFLTMIEHGRKNPPIWMLARLSEIFGVTVDEIIK